MSKAAINSEFSIHDDNYIYDQNKQFHWDRQALKMMQMASKNFC